MSILEEELYIPVKKYFENKGFKIKGEVKNCDMAGVKGDILIVVELKRNFNLNHFKFPNFKTTPNFTKHFFK